MSDLQHLPPRRTFRLVTIRQADGTWYGGLHAVSICRGAYGFASRDLAWSYAWDQQQSLVREIEARFAEDADDSDVDPRDPHPTREGMFRLHNCARCGSGKRPCVRGNPRQCEYPHARND